MRRLAAVARWAVWLTCLLSLALATFATWDTVRPRLDNPSGFPLFGIFVWVLALGCGMVAAAALICARPRRRPAIVVILTGCLGAALFLLSAHDAGDGGAFRRAFRHDHRAMEDLAHRALSGTVSSGTRDGRAGAMLVSVTAGCVLFETGLGGWVDAGGLASCPGVVPDRSTLRVGVERYKGDWYLWGE